ncbi:hypothetical protein KUTeg_024191 [Tegillarca granosa]|uniref:Uncharacterized protein n=1 Tax=Tegillarca granosa TaxID=220873 RepID=A0ABQ9E2A9_TEGGR|nr:hypothetical protein KUTeg_024191 [Tegillarca granosa]
MSRSFYVDSLIVKRSSPSSTESMCTKTPVNLSSSVGHHQHNLQPSSLPTGHQHPLPCYPRHSSDVLSLCCPLCIHTPSALIPESGSSLPSMNPSLFTSSSSGVPSLHAPPGYTYQRHLPLTSLKHHHASSREKYIPVLVLQVQLKIHIVVKESERLLQLRYGFKTGVLNIRKTTHWTHHEKCRCLRTCSSKSGKGRFTDEGLKHLHESEPAEKEIHLSNSDLDMQNDDSDTDTIDPA